MTEKHQHSKFFSRISFGKQLSILLILIMGVMTMNLGTNMAATITTDGQIAVDLGTSGNFAILAKTGISTTGTTHITGDMGVSPIDSTAITGFSLILEAGNASSTSSLVNGSIYAADYDTPTPTMLTAAILDMESAFDNATSRVGANFTELGTGEIGGMTLTPGLYNWSTGVTATSDVTISGNASDVWVFQIAQDLTLSTGVNVLLSGGAVADNIFWVVSGQTTIGTNAVIHGNILCKTGIVFNTGSTLYGRALAQTAVTLDSTTIVIPGSTDSTTATTTSSTSTATTTSTTNTTTGTTTTSATSTTTISTVSTSSTPASSTPASSTPASSTPASSTPASSTPASSTPASSTPASSTPASSSTDDASMSLLFSSLGIISISTLIFRARSKKSIQ